MSVSNSKFKSGVKSTSGNIDGAASGTATAGAKIACSRVVPGSLSATFVVDAETNTITLAAGWEVSADGSTWVTVANAPQNPASVVLATGTSGADASVTRVVPAPSCVSGHRFARAVVINGAATGTANDTYAISYNYVDA